MVALLVAMSVMAIAMSVALPTWRTLAQREKEAELIFRGEQYARAIALFQRRYANASPPNLDVLINERFLRKKYLDPMTGGDFALLTAGQPVPGEGQQPQAPSSTNPSGGRGGGIDLRPSGRQGGAAAGSGGGFQPLGGGTGFQPAGGGVGRGGIVGVVSTSTERSFRLYNGRDAYNQWVFMGVQQGSRVGGPGGAPGAQGGRGGVDGRGGADGRGGPGGRGVDGRGGRDGRGGLQPMPGRGAQPTFGGRGPGGR